ncbi:MAG: hypothetical protein ACE37K_06185 [Planctomycetota bacterium]
MPLDLTAAVAAFADRFALQRRGIADAFKVIEKWLKARKKQAEALELASRRYPAIDFHFGGQVMLRLDRSQHRTLARGEPSDFVRSLERGGREFVDGIAYVGRAASQEWLLPNLATRLRRISDLVVASMARFATSRLASDTFDPDRRTASDSIGLAARGWRALAESNRQLQLFVVRLHLAKFLVQLDETPQEELERKKRAASSPPKPSVSFADRLGEAARYLTAGVLLLPILPQYLQRLFEAVWLRGRLTLLDEFAGYERRVFRFRTRIVDTLFRELPKLATKAFRFVLAAKFVISSNLDYFVSFARIYGSVVLREVRRFSHELQQYLEFFRSLVETTRRILERVMNFDLMPFLIAPLGLPGAILHALGHIPRLTIGDLVDTAGHIVRIRARDSLTNFIMAVRIAMLAGGLATQQLYWRHVKAKLDLLQAIVSILFQAPAPYPAETRRPRLPNRFPNLFNAFFGPAGRSFVRHMEAMGRGLAASVGTTLRAGERVLRDLALLFDHQAVVASLLVDPAVLRALDSRSAATSDRLFGDQIRELRQRVATARGDTVAGSFERWLVSSGFEMVAAAIPVYLSEMQRFWRREAAVGAEPTVELSELERMQPVARQRLARRLGLGRVRLDAVTIDAQDRELSSDLVARITDRFQTVIRTAYRVGRARLLSVQGNQAGAT